MPCCRMARREPITLALTLMFTTLITPEADTNLQRTVIVGESLRCVQCVSFHVPQCHSGHIAPEPCPEKNSTSCVHFMATEKNKPTDFGLVNRACHSGPETPGCKIITENGKDYKSCTVYCYTDGCNNLAVPIATQTFTVYLLLTSLLVLVHCEQ